MKADMRVIESEIKNGVGIITLNRPDVLNAMNWEMTQALFKTLTDWKEDYHVHMVVFEGAGDKAFCAGGDVRAIYQAHQGKNESMLREFYHTEYALDDLIARFPKPIISFCEGITMGGGMGIAVNGRYRIVSDKSLWAMPECKIGFFPDVGAGYFLNDCPGQIGLYLALTGERMNAAEALYAGLATHYVPSEKMDVFCNTLIQAETDAYPEEVLQQSLEMFAEEPQQFNSLQENKAEIDDVFASKSVEDIVQALQGIDSKWAQGALEKIEAASPTSLKVTFAHLRHCRRERLKVADVLKLDYHLSQHFVKGKDFYEGVRALLIDRDNQPQWDPSTLEGVSDTVVNGYLMT